jgi:hypothetical protein
LTALAPRNDAAHVEMLHVERDGDLPIVDAARLIQRGHQLYRSGGLPRGDSTGWPCVDEFYTVAPGQWTVITGVPGSGKSEWLDALLVNLAETEQWEFALYSPENFPTVTHLVKLVEKHERMPFGEGPTKRMTEQEYRYGAIWVCERFFWLEPTLKTPDELIEAGIRHRNAGKKFGIVLDPWNTLEHQRGPMNETDYVSFILSSVMKLARSAVAHIWLVVHPAKIPRNKDGTRPVPTPYDISGCYDDETEVLTRRGWLRHADIVPGDEVAAFNPTTSAMQFERPSRVVRRDHDGAMHRYRGYGFDLLVTPDHRMLVKPQWQGESDRWPKDAWSFCESQQLPHAQFMLPLAAPLAEPGAAFDLRLAQLAGWYVAEGSAMSCGVSICQAVGEKAAAIDALLASLKLRVTRKVNGPGGNGGVQRIVTWYLGARFCAALVQWLRLYAGTGSANKRIPQEILDGTPAVKAAFLAAYLDGDGAARSHGGFSAVTTSPTLRDQLQQLALELGMNCSWLARQGTKPNHAQAWQLNIGGRRETSLRAQRNRSVEHYTGTVWCLTLPSGAYFVRRNGRVCVCGNSAHWYNKPDNIITVHRDQADGGQMVDVHVQKVRFKHIGHAGLAMLRYDKVTGRYFDLPGIPGENYVDPERRV